MSANGEKRGAKGDQSWRWMLRVTGLVSFVIFIALLSIGRDVPVVFLLIAAGMMGLDSIQGFELRRKNGK